MCPSCTQANRKKCAKYYRTHAEAKKAYSRKQREAYRAIGRCITCGAPLYEESEGHVKCVNCRLGITWKDEVSYAANHPQDAIGL